MGTTDMNRLKYIPQLNGLRFFAAFAVMLQHWVTNQIGLPAPLGYGGVTLFFVLSGFLITCILIGSKADHHRAGEPTSAYFKRFYLRRVLRIFPLYLFCTAALFAADVGGVRENIWWFMAHAINIKFFLQGAYDHWVNHFWSLAIEEQFYLIYPALIFLAPRRFLPHLMAGLVALALATKMALMGMGYSYRAIGFFTLGCFDAFGVGGLMGWLYTFHLERFKSLMNNPRTWLAVTIFAALMVSTRVMWGETGSGQAVWFRLVVSLFSALVIGKGVVGYGGLIQWILENKAISYMGKISYGLYVYHNFMPYIAKPWLGKLANSVTMAPVYFIATVIVSAISWELMEKFFNGLKDKMPAAQNIKF